MGSSGAFRLAYRPAKESPANAKLSIWGTFSRAALFVTLIGALVRMVARP
jgi:hypothetical protein